MICVVLKPRLHFSSTTRSDTSMALLQSAGASGFTSLRQQTKPNRMKGQVITAARRGAAWRPSLVPGVLRSAPHAQKRVSKYAFASAAGPLMEECFGPLKEPGASEDGREGKKCVCLVTSATRGMKHKNVVWLLWLCPCGKQPHIHRKGLWLAKASGSRSKHVASGLVLTVLAQHFLLVTGVFNCRLSSTGVRATHCRTTTVLFVLH